MNRSLIRITAYLQLGIMILIATGCAPTQPFFYNESPDLQYYLNSATRIEYPDVSVESLPETTQAVAPLTLGNHDYQFWDLTLEECVSIALQNAKFFVTTGGNAEFRQNIAAQFTSSSAEQLGSIYDVAIQQSTTSPQQVTTSPTNGLSRNGGNGAGSRIQQRNVLRANQIGGVEDALAEFDAVASGAFQIAKGDRPANTGFSAVSTPQLRNTDVSQISTISKRYATGGVGTLRQIVAYNRSNLPTSLAPNTAGRRLASDWTALLEAEVQHPLMRNRGTMINRIPVVLASLNEDVSIADFEIQVRNLVRDVEVAYWDLYVAYRNVSTAIIGRNSAIATSKFAQLNLDNGTGTKQEVAQANEQYYNFRARLSSALAGSNVLGDERQGVYGSERALRERLGLAATDGRLIRPIEEPSIARVEYDWEELVAEMLNLSPELRKGKTSIKQRELELITAKNQILPEVNLSLLYRWVGIGDTLGPPSRRDANFPDPGSSALGELTEGNYQEGLVQLEVLPPAIGRRRELARIRGSQLQIQRARAFLQESERLLVSQLSDAVAKTATHYQLVQTHAMRWQAAEQEVEARLAEFKGGRSPVNVVLQSQQRRADAQIAYYRALGEYNKSLNYVDYLKGTILANNNITVAEGPWNKKAYWDALERARERSAGKKLQYGVTRPGVVRRGPLRQIIGSGINATGDTMPPDAVLLDGPATDSMGLESPYRDSIEVDDRPLGEMGSPDEMFAPDPSIEILPRPEAIEVLPEGLPRSIPDERPNTSPLGPGRSGVTTPLQAPQSDQDLTTASFQESLPQDDVQINDAPLPVRRKPLPSFNR